MSICGIQRHVYPTRSEATWRIRLPTLLFNGTGICLLSALVSCQKKYVKSLVNIIFWISNTLAFSCGFSRLEINNIYKVDLKYFIIIIIYITTISDLFVYPHLWFTLTCIRTIRIIRLLAKLALDHASWNSRTKNNVPILK